MTFSFANVLRVFICLVTIQLLIPNLNAKNPVVYLIPGQGADYRLFKNLEISDGYDVQYVHFTTPEKGWTMREYAVELSKQIDTSQPFILIGTSLGGMLATEMADFLEPEKIILIASAKTNKELPFRYTFQKKIPLYKLVPPNLSLLGAKILQPIVEPDRNKEKEVFKQMLKDKDPLFLKRTISMIVNWNRTEFDSNIVHLHGDKDRTIPIKNVSYNYLINNGSHMMTCTRGPEISGIINDILKSS